MLSPPGLLTATYLVLRIPESGHITLSQTPIIASTLANVPAQRLRGSSVQINNRPHKLTRSREFPWATMGIVGIWVAKSKNRSESDSPQGSEDAAYHRLLPHVTYLIGVDIPATRPVTSRAWVRHHTLLCAHTDQMDSRC